MGFELARMEGGESELHFLPRREHMNSFNVAHGGVIMALMDVTLATAARSVDAAVVVLTIEVKTTFMQPCVGQLTSKGRLIHRTGSMGFCEATIRDAQGRACAHATGTFKYVKRPAVTASGPDVISTD